jgi:hypothetical protein
VRQYGHGCDATRRYPPETCASRGASVILAALETRNIRSSFDILDKTLDKWICQ